MENKQYEESNISKVYDPKLVEDRWYQFWLDNNLFHAKNGEDRNNNYSVVILHQILPDCT